MKISDYQRRELKNINFKSFFIEEDRIDSVTKMAIKIADIAYPEHTLKIPILKTQKEEFIAIMESVLWSVSFATEEFIDKFKVKSNKDLNTLQSNFRDFIRKNHQLIYGIHPDLAHTFKDIESPIG